MIVVTGASQNHSKTLSKMIGTFVKFHGSEDNVKLIVYNLGIEKETWEELMNKYKDAENIYYKMFDYSLYPSYFDINVKAGEYAWKPVIIYDECEKSGEDLVVWMDSGNEIEERLIELKKFTRINGVYSGQTRGNIDQWTHHRTIEYMDAKNTGDRMRNGACVAFNYSIDWVKTFVKEYRDLACTKECIAPEGSNRSNHRQDQSVLSILFYKYHRKYNFEYTKKFLGFGIQRDCG